MKVDRAKEEIRKILNNISEEISKDEEMIYKLIFNKLPEEINWDEIDKRRAIIKELKIEYKAINFASGIYEPEIESIDKLKQKVKEWEIAFQEEFAKSKQEVVKK